MPLTGQGVAGTVKTIGEVGLIFSAAVAVVIQLLSAVGAVAQTGKGVGLLKGFMAAGRLRQLLPCLLIYNDLV